MVISRRIAASSFLWRVYPSSGQSSRNITRPCHCEWRLIAFLPCLIGFFAAGDWHSYTWIALQQLLHPAMPSSRHPPSSSWSSSHRPSEFRPFLRIVIRLHYARRRELVILSVIAQKNVSYEVANFSLKPSLKVAPTALWLRLLLLFSSDLLFCHVAGSRFPKFTFSQKK